MKKINKVTKSEVQQCDIPAWRRMAMASIKAVRYEVGCWYYIITLNGSMRL